MEGEATPVPRNEANNCAPRDLAFNSSQLEGSFIIGFSFFVSKNKKMVKS